jgi:nicotinamide-nucleotide amidase
MTDSVLKDDSGRIAALAARIVAHGHTVATAESCTGGMVATAITDVPGSSAVLLAGFVTYANEAKMALVGVPGDVLRDYGAVSEECVAAMARGALLRSGADLAVAISGVAGPGGGSAAKPVGTVCFGLAVRRGEDVTVTAHRQRFPADASRTAIRLMATEMALQMLADA